MPLDPSAFGTQKQPTAAPAEPAAPTAPLPAGQRPGFKPTEAPVQPGPGLLGAGPFSTPEEVTERAAAGLPRPAAAIIRAFQKSLGGEAALTLVPREVSGVTGNTPSYLGSPADEALAAVELLTMASPGGRAANLAAARVQGILETVTGNPNMAHTVVSLVQAGEAGVSAIKSMRQLPQKAKAIFGEAMELKNAAVTRLGKAVHTPQETLAKHVQMRTRLGLNRAKFRAKTALDAAEAPYIGIDIAPNSPGYVATMRAMTGLSNDGKLTGDARRAFDRIDEAISNGKPVKGADVVELRQMTADKSRYGTNPLDPDRPMGPERINRFRDELATALEYSGTRRQGIDFQTARTNYHLNYTKPARALETLTNANTKPSEAFDAIFHPANRDLFVNMTRHIAQNKGLQGKLRMGFIDKMTRPDGELYENANEVFRAWRNALATSGVFTKEELHAMDKFTQAKEIPTLRDTFSLLLPAGKRRGQILPAVIGIGGVSTFGTGRMLGLIAAAGGLLSLRRMRLLGANNPQSRLAAALISSRVDDFAKALYAETDHEPHNPGEPGDE